MIRRYAIYSLFFSCRSRFLIHIQINDLRPSPGFLKLKKKKHFMGYFPFYTNNSLMHCDINYNWQLWHSQKTTKNRKTLVFSIHNTTTQHFNTENNLRPDVPPVNSRHNWNCNVNIRSEINHNNKKPTCHKKYCVV